MKTGLIEISLSSFNREKHLGNVKLEGFIIIERITLHHNRPESIMYTINIKCLKLFLIPIKYVY